jgi:hypothetical protein
LGGNLVKALASDLGTIRVYTITDDATSALVCVSREQVDQPEDTVRRTLQDRLTAALATNRDYLAQGTPTAAQTSAQVSRLTRQTQGLIRLALSALDSADGAG